jgi:hypothetical protein
LDFVVLEREQIKPLEFAAWSASVRRVRFAPVRAA